MSHSWMRQVTLVNKSCHTHQWVKSYTSHSCVRHDSFIRVAWLIYLWHGSLIRDMTHTEGKKTGGDSLLKQRPRFHVCGMTRSYVWHDLFIRDMAHLFVWWLVHRARRPTVTRCRNNVCGFMCVTWLVLMCGMTHLSVTWLINPWYDSYIGHEDKRWLAFETTSSKSANESRPLQCLY